MQDYNILFMYISSTILLLVLLAGLILIINAARKKHLQERELHLADIIFERERIMSFISDELHDNVNQVQHYILLEIRLLKQKLSSAENQPNREIIEKLEPVMLDLIKDVKYLAYSLNKRMILKIGLKDSFKELAHRVEHGKNIHCTLDIPENPDILIPSTIALTIYRIVQEAVHNSLKYSEATEIMLSLKKEGKDMLLMIQDNGKGFSLLSDKEGAGLSSMRKRSRSIHGIIDIQSAPEHGTRISVRFADFGKAWYNHNGSPILTFDDVPDERIGK